MFHADLKVYITNSGVEKIKKGFLWILRKDLEDKSIRFHMGAIVEILSLDNKFVAYGVAHPTSVIAIRLFAKASKEHPLSVLGIIECFKDAFNFRKKLNLVQFSYRLMFAEADSMPGMIADHYRLINEQHVLVFEAQTAYADIIIKRIDEWIKILCLDVLQIPYEKTSVVIKNNQEVRLEEGLTVEKEPTIYLKNPEVDLFKAQVLVENLSQKDQASILSTDLLYGQKTGLFLDQKDNILKLIELVKAKQSTSWKNKKEIFILDLCSYVGHWSVQLATYAKQMDMIASCTLVDASSKALNFARTNLTDLSTTSSFIKGDVLKVIPTLDKKFDIIICDPPGFIKSRENLSQGKRAYTRINLEALKLLNQDAIFVTCSCSGALKKEEFVFLIKEIQDLLKINIQKIAEGSSAMDHPKFNNFVESDYLKVLFFNS